ncbi:Lysosomal Pro-X carboxypeptidase, partial [Bienertia sinuspersici]
EGYKVVNFTQKLDHFGYYPENKDVTFEQKVFINDTFWAGVKAKAPIFVLFGGEMGETYGPDYVRIMALSGVKFRALLIHIQHRFYGDSIPSGSIDLAMDNHMIRGCLTTEQALQDFAEIILSVKANYSAYASPVIVLGCGYAGALAVWFRLRYPETVIGALASSTPLLYYANYTSTGGPLQSAEEVKQWFGQMLSFAAKYVNPNNGLIHNVCKYVDEMGDNVLEAMAYALHPKLYTEACIEGQYLIEVESPFEIPTKTTVAWQW